MSDKEPAITRLQASVPRPQVLDGYVWIDVSTPERTLFVSQIIPDAAYTARFAKYTNHAAFDGDEELAARVDKAVEEFRLTLRRAASNIDQDEAARLRREIEDVTAANASLLEENRRLREANEAFKAKEAHLGPRLQPEDIPPETDAKSMDDLRLPDVPQEAASGRRHRRG